MTDIRADEAQPRPKYPHLDNLERVLVKDPEYLRRGLTVTEKVHGFNARVGRDPDGVLWVGTRTQHFDAESAPTFQGFTDYARGAFERLPAGLTLYGEWAGKGVQKGIDYGEKRFFVFGERLAGCPVLSSTAVLDQHWELGAATVPVIYEGSEALLDVLDGLRRGESIIAPGQPIEGVVIAPLDPVIDEHGHQVIAKYKSPQFAEKTHVEREALDFSRADEFAAEYVNAERLRHVLDQVVEAHPTTERSGQIIVVNIDPLDVEHTGTVLRATFQDVVREGSDDYEALSAEDRKLVGKSVNRRALAILAELRGDAAREAVEVAQQETT